MKPDYEYSDKCHIRFFNCDNMEFMKEIPDNYYELCICDPPYGINAPKMSATPCQRKVGSKRLNGGSGKLKNRKLNSSNFDWDNEIPKQKYFDELFRISKNQIIWGGNYFPLKPTRCIICWDKVQPWENFSQIEIAWTSFDSPAQLFKYDNRTGDKIHPTQKPIVLYRWLLQKYAKQGDKILDTHGGSMTIARACYEEEFDLDIMELDKEYFDKGVHKFKEHVSQIKLF